jgi:hypothetical protein
MPRTVEKTKWSIIYLLKLHHNGILLGLSATDESFAGNNSFSVSQRFFPLMKPMRAFTKQDMFVLTVLAFHLPLQLAIFFTLLYCRKCLLPACLPLNVFGQLKAFVVPFLVLPSELFSGPVG